MTTTYRYRFIKWSWGIAIDITGDILSADTYRSQKTFISDKIALGIDTRLLDQDIPYLKRGAELVAPVLEAAIDIQHPILIHITDTWTNFTDYQPEGYTPALVGWVAQHFQIEMPKIEVTFDRASNRYSFWVDGQLI